MSKYEYYIIASKTVDYYYVERVDIDTKKIQRYSSFPISGFSILNNLFPEIWSKRTAISIIENDIRRLKKVADWVPGKRIFYEQDSDT